MHPFRVFISYAHADAEIVQRIESVLRDRKFVPVRDESIQPGMFITDEIKIKIATAHVFMPFISPTSHERPFVQQEIGFALGIDVPVLPVVIEGSLPAEMLTGVQPVYVRADLTDLEDRMRDVDLLPLMIRDLRELQRLGITNRVADFSEERTQLLADYAESVLPFVHIRQRAIFSSFSLPDAPPHSSVWNAIDLSQQRSEHYRAQLQRERKNLELHARNAGCSLIIHPFVDFAPVGALVHCTQLQELRSFLQSMPATKIRIAVSRRGFEGNLTLIGDAVGIKAGAPRPGADFRQTVFTRHAPTVLRWLLDFERELRSLLHGIRGNESRDAAIAIIEERLKSLPC